MGAAQAAGVYSLLPFGPSHPFPLATLQEQHIHIQCKGKHRIISRVTSQLQSKGSSFVHLLLQFHWRDSITDTDWEGMWWYFWVEELIASDGVPEMGASAMCRRSEVSSCCHQPKDHMHHTVAIPKGEGVLCKL